MPVPAAQHRNHNLAAVSEAVDSGTGAGLGGAPTVNITMHVQSSVVGGTAEDIVNKLAPQVVDALKRIQGQSRVNIFTGRQRDRRRAHHRIRSSLRESAVPSGDGGKQSTHLAAHSGKARIELKTARALIPESVRDRISAVSQTCAEVAARQG